MENSFEELLEKALERFGPCLTAAICGVTQQTPRLWMKRARWPHPVTAEGYGKRLADALRTAETDGVVIISV